MHDQLLVQVLALLLDMGIAFHLLVLLLHFVLAHPQAFAILVTLPGQVRQRNRPVRQSDVPDHDLQNAAYARSQPVQPAMGNGHQRLQGIPYHQRDQHRQKQDLAYRLDELHQVARREDILQIAGGIQFLRRRLELSKRQHDAYLQEFGEHPHPKHDENQRSEHADGLIEDFRQHGPQCDGEPLVGKGRRRQYQRSQRRENGRGIDQKVPEQGAYQRRLGKVPAVCDLAFLAGIAQALRGGPLGFLAAHGPGHAECRNGTIRPTEPRISPAYWNNVAMYSTSTNSTSALFTGRARKNTCS